MSDLPTMYVITVEGDTTDADYTGVTKRTTATGAEYRIVGPLAEALRGLQDRKPDTPPRISEDYTRWRIAKLEAELADQRMCVNCGRYAPQGA